MNEKQLIKRMPMVLAGALDPYQHKTAADFRFMAQHELDLHAEGEIELTRRDQIAIRRFIQFLNRRQYES